MDSTPRKFCLHAGQPVLDSSPEQRFPLGGAAVPEEIPRRSRVVGGVTGLRGQAPSSRGHSLFKRLPFKRPPSWRRISPGNLRAPAHCQGVDRTVGRFRTLLEMVLPTDNTPSRSNGGTRSVIHTWLCCTRVLVLRVSKISQGVAVRECHRDREH